VTFHPKPTCRPIENLSAETGQRRPIKTVERPVAEKDFKQGFRSAIAVSNNQFLMVTVTANPSYCGELRAKIKDALCEISLVENSRIILPIPKKEKLAYRSS
jgi:hypothetical protein